MVLRYLHRITQNTAAAANVLQLIASQDLRARAGSGRDCSGRFWLRDQGGAPHQPPANGSAPRSQWSEADRLCSLTARSLLVTVTSSRRRRRVRTAVQISRGDMAARSWVEFGRALLMLGLILLSMGAALPSLAQQSAGNGHWVGTWGASPSDPLPGATAPSYSNQSASVATTSACVSRIPSAARPCRLARCTSRCRRQWRDRTGDGHGANVQRPTCHDHKSRPPGTADPAS